MLRRLPEARGLPSLSTATSAKFSPLVPVEISPGEQMVLELKHTDAPAGSEELNADSDGCSNGIVSLTTGADGIGSLQYK